MLLAFYLILGLVKKLLTNIIQINVSVFEGRFLFLAWTIDRRIPLSCNTDVKPEEFQRNR